MRDCLYASSNNRNGTNWSPSSCGTFGNKTHFGDEATRLTGHRQSIDNDDRNWRSLPLDFQYGSHSLEASIGTGRGRMMGKLCADGERRHYCGIPQTICFHQQSSFKINRMPVSVNYLPTLGLLFYLLPRAISLLFDGRCCSTHELF